VRFLELSGSAGQPPSQIDLEKCSHPHDVAGTLL
jgi:hypothetical protein